jgi:hypothetical protein
MADLAKSRRDGATQLSVQQRCKYRGASFLKSLLSQEDDVEALSPAWTHEESAADHRGLSPRLVPDVP